MNPAVEPAQRNVHIGEKHLPGLLFEEPGALEQVIEHAGDWFETHLPGTRQR